VTSTCHLVSLNSTTAATDLRCFNVVGWATKGLSICEFIFNFFLYNGRPNKITNVVMAYRHI